MKKEELTEDRLYELCHTCCEIHTRVMHKIVSATEEFVELEAYDGSELRMSYRELLDDLKLVKVPVRFLKLTLEEKID